MGVTLTPSWSSRPAPFVEILVDGIPAGVDSFTVYRKVGGRTFPVRGMVKALAAGGASQRDYEAPFNVRMTYLAEWFTDGLSVGFSEPVTTTLYGLEEVWAWFHNPLDPQSSVKVRLLLGAAAQIVRNTDGTVLSIPGRSVGLTLPGTRGGVKQVVLDCYTDTKEDTEKFDALFGGYDDDALSIVCVRALPETWLPPTLFAFVASPVKRPLGNQGQRATWGVTGDETVPPAPAFITPLLTYQHFTDFYAAYDQFTAAYPTYLDASRDYSIVGS
jgi:hypothetical protein